MIDCYATEPHFLDHLAPVWKALGEAQGDFLVWNPLIERAYRRGVQGTMHAQDPTRPILVASYGDVKRVRKQGRTRIAFIEHGIGQSYEGNTSGSYAGGRDRADVSLFMMPNEYSAQRWRAAYPQARVEVIGSPHLDDLPQRESGASPVIAIAFHWNCTMVPETMGAINHYRKVLPDLAQAYSTIGHTHPRALPILKRHYRRASIPLIDDFHDVCRLADLYICDNSSSLYEFAATGRPVVVLNDPAYRKDVQHGLRFWDAADVGIQVEQPDQLIDAVQRALVDGVTLQRKRRVALNKVYAYPDGASQRAASILIEWAGSQEVGRAA